MRNVIAFSCCITNNETKKILDRQGETIHDLKVQGKIFVGEQRYLSYSTTTNRVTYIDESSVFVNDQTPAEVRARQMAEAGQEFGTGIDHDKPTLEELDDVRHQCHIRHVLGVE